MTVSYIADRVVRMNRTANLLGALGLAIYDEMIAAMADAVGLSPIDASAINAIGQQPGASVSFVAMATGLTHAGAVRVVDRLVANELVSRAPGPDARTVAVRLTPAGRKLLTKQRNARGGPLEHLVSMFDPAERSSIDTLLETLLTALTGDVHQAEHLCRLCDEASCPQNICPVTLAIAS
jgi:MarR family transcriptional regulator, negative regulator of the multidrug operon emrRAB